MHSRTTVLAILLAAASLGGCLLDRELYERRRTQLLATGGPDTSSPDDVDGDGFAEDDCDDNDASIHPGAQETPYDGVDQDCDDLDLTDVDGDGFDAEQAGGSDCDDGDAEVHPEATEAWNDAFQDNNCDGELSTAPTEWLNDPILGPTAGANLGRVVEAWTSDDGQDLGVVAGLPLYDTEAPGGGSVTVWSNNLSDQHTVHGVGEAAFLGVAVHGVPSATGTGTADLLISATGTETGTGAVFLLSESQLLSGPHSRLPADESAVIRGTDAGSYFGSSIASLSDIDGDGHTDVVVSAPFAAAGGNVQAGVVGHWTLTDIVSRGEVWLDGASSIASGESTNSHFGNSLSGLGDINGDGYDDLLATGDVGAVGTVLAGSAFGLDDDNVAMKLYGSIEAGHERGRVLPIGDINGDDRTDIAFVDEDYIELFTAIAGSSTAVVGAGHARIEVEPGDFGSYVFDVAGIPDADGDGRGELVIPVAKYGPANYGSVVAVFPGSALTFGSRVAFADAPASLLIQRFDANTGYSVAVASDIDGDGRGDLLLGAPNDSQAGTDAGAIALVPVPR